MLNPDRIRKVVIVGRDEALWMAANVLWVSFHRAGIEITAVELPSMLRPGDVFPTLRSQEAFNGMMGLQEGPLMQACQATFTLGQRFANFAKTRAPFMHAYSTYGLPIERVAFHHHWIRARAQGMKAEYEDFSLGAVAARQGRFFIPGAETDGFAECDYGYHLGAAAYCQVLKQTALKRGVNHVSGRLAQAVIAPDDGRITAVQLLDGQVVEGDFFIDGSGPESLLLGKALGVGFESWHPWFPCDRLMTTYAPPLSPLPSYSQISASRSGWLGLFPLRDRVAVQQVYASVDMNDQEAYEAAGIISSLRFTGDAVVTPFTPGRRTTLWARNCVAIGEAAVVTDPIDSVRLQVNMAGLSHLIALFPVDRNMTVESREYNSNAIQALERLRDYQICHYKLNQRFDQPLWDHCRQMALPDMLAYKLDLFTARGSLVIYDDETFTDDDWVSMFIGHGLIPQAYDPLADQVPESEVIQRFQKILGFVRMNVEKMRPMEAYLGRTAVSGA